MGAADTAKNRKNADRQTLLIYRSATRDARSHMMHDFPKFNRRIQLAITQPHRRLQAQFFDSVFRNSARTI